MSKLFDMNMLVNKLNKLLEMNKLNILMNKFIC